MGLDNIDQVGKTLTEWPDFFEVDSVELVQKTELKPKPKLSNFKSMESLLKDYNIREQLDRQMRDYDCQSQGATDSNGNQGAMRMSTPAVQKDSLSDGNILQNSDIMSEQRESDIECLSQHGISAQTLNMIQTKEKLEDEAKQRNMKNLEKETYKRELHQHLRVAEALRGLYIDQKKRVIFLNEVIDHLQNRIFGQFIDAGEMKRVIGSITRILPKWAQIKTIPKGVLLGLDGI